MKKESRADAPVFLTSNTSWYLYNFRRSTIEALQAKGQTVVCLSPNDEFSNRLEFELGVKHISVPLDGKSLGIVAELRTLRFIWNIIEHEKPKFLFNFTIKMNIYCGLVCIVKGVPFANNISGLGTAFLHDSWILSLVRLLYGIVNRRAQRLFFQNEEDLSAFRQAGLLGDAQVTLLPGSGVDLQHFSPSPLPSRGPVTFIMIARLLGDKGVREYAEACSRLHHTGANVRCLLVGPLGVSNRTAISEEEVTQWHQKGILEYVGFTDDVRPHIEEAHVLVLPSYREGMPRAVLEAAAMGRPAIVSDVAGCRQSIEPGVTGWLCDARNVDSLVNQMRNFLAMDRAKREQAGEAARRRMERMFSQEVVVMAYLDCLPK